MYLFIANILSPLFSNRFSIVFFQCFTRLQAGRVIMTDSSNVESAGSDCGHICRDRRPACDDFFFVVAICSSATLCIARGILLLEIFALLLGYAT
jgi:hypothetical protein